MDGDHGEPPPAAPLHTDDMDHGDLEEYVQTEGGDDGMEYNVMDEDEEAEQDAAQRLREELKQKRLVSMHLNMSPAGRTPDTGSIDERKLAGVLCGGK